VSFAVVTIIDRARETLQDLEKDRYSDQRLLDALNMAISSMQRVRPDITALWDVIPDYPYSANNIAGTLLPVSQQFLEPLVAFVIGWVEVSDDEFATDNRANTLLTRFTAQLMIGG